MIAPFSSGIAQPQSTAPVAGSWQFAGNQSILGEQIKAPNCCFQIAGVGTTTRP